MTTTIYVLEVCYPYEGCSILGVFSSRERAEAHRTHLADTERHYAEDLKITDWTLDALAAVAP